jgi:PTH1 family peptidyl-tRNA hydrolase
VLGELRRRWEFGRAKEKFHARCWSGELRRQPVMLVAPQTYMNRSGLTVAEVTTFYKVAPEDVLVVLDDMALPLGQVRARAQGSAGGHKGLSDVLSALGTEQVPRVRIGIGSPPPHVEAIDFVLTEFRPGQRRVMEEALELAAQAVEDWVREGIESVMNRYNRKAKEEPPKAESGT